MSREEAILILKELWKYEHVEYEDCEVRAAIDMAIEALQPKTSWIPVSERLPEEGEDVLVWYRYWRYGEYNNWYYTYGIGYQYNDNWSVIDGGIRTTVFAWMPLPEPYKESEVQ